jgi:hypothetical protein
MVDPGMAAYDTGAGISVEMDKNEELRDASGKGDLNKVNELLDAGADLHSPDSVSRLDMITESPNQYTPTL